MISYTAIIFTKKLKWQTIILFNIADHESTILFSILFVITIIAAILALCVWLMFHSASESHYPDVRDL